MRAYQCLSIRLLGFFALLLMVNLACNQSSTPTELPPISTDTPPPSAALPTEIRTPLPPPPTATPSPIPPTATPDRTGTAAANATATGEAAVALIDAELRKIDLSTGEGHLGFVHNAFTLKVNTYMERKKDTDYPDVVAADFVLQSEVTWNSTSGLAGCAFLIRSEADFDRGKQYRVYLMRLSGLPLWDIEYFNAGKFQYNVTERVLDTGYLDVGPDATNTITIVAQGDKLTVYANGNQMRVVTDSKLKEGHISFMAWQESGETTCEFDNTWLWVYK